jgi:hypothetical protein
MMPTATSTRFDIADRLDAEAGTLVYSIHDEVHSYRPLGIASDLSLAMGTRPKRGVLIGTPLGPFVFAKARAPAKAVIDGWFDSYRRAEALRGEAIRYRAFSIERQGTTIGNRRPAETGRELADEGLLDEAETAWLATLEAFWAAHPDADTGVVNDDGTITPLGGPYGWDIR